MGKRKTAKTGDRALYNSRDKTENSAKKNVDDDDMYNEVDRYNNARDELQDDMLKFGDDNDDSEEEGLQNDVEGVFDLGLDHSDDESDSDSYDSSGEEEPESASLQKAMKESDDSDDDSSVDGSDEDAETNILDWGKRKKDYYHGDTADLEIGQDVEDAELEEEGAKEVLKARLEGMTEDDYMLDDDDDDSDDDGEGNDNFKDAGRHVEMITSGVPSTKRRKLSQLTKKEKLKLMSKKHPELLPIVNHFRREVIQPCAEKTSVVVDALFDDIEYPEVRNKRVVSLLDL